MITSTWTGLGGDADWFNPSNWDNGIPTAADAAIIDTLVTVAIAGAAEVDTLTVSGGATLSLALAGTLDVGDVFALGSDGTLGFDRGVLRGGSLDLSPGAQVLVGTQAQSSVENALDDVLLTGALLTASIANRLTFANGVRADNDAGPFGVDVLARFDGGTLTLRADAGSLNLSQRLEMETLLVLGDAPDDTLTIAPGGEATGSGALAGTLPGLSGPLTVINDGVIEARVTGGTLGDGFMNVVPDVFTNNATMRALAGTTLRIGEPAAPLGPDRAFTNLADGALIGGFYDVLDTAALQINGAVDAISTLAAQISMTGPDARFQVNGADLETTLETLAVGGQLNLFFGADFETTNAVAIDGFLNLQGSAFGGAAGTTVSATGFIGGFGEILGPLTNNGTVLAAGTPADPLLAVLGDVDGAGTFQITGGNTLSFAGAVEASLVSFLNGTADDERLMIDDIASFDAPIGGLAEGDVIEIDDLGATSAALNGSDPQQLDIFFGTEVVASLALDGDFSGVDFAVTNNGESGIEIGIGVQQPVAVYNGVLELFGPDAFDYRSLFPPLSEATGAVLEEIGGGRHRYAIDYGGGRQAVFEGMGLTRASTFEPTGGTVDRIEVFDSQFNDPLLLARFSSDPAGGNPMAIPFDASLEAGLTTGGPAFYQQLLLGNNRHIGGPNDDIFNDDRGDNSFSDTAGTNILFFSDKVTSLESIDIDGDTATITYIDDPNVNLINTLPLIPNLIWLNIIIGLNNTVAPGLVPFLYPEGYTAGDPHNVTFDRLHYSIQTVGEHVLTQATDGSDFEIHVRYQPLDSAIATFTTQAGLRIGDQVVNVDAGGFGETVVLLDGVDIAAQVASVGDSLALDAGVIERISSRNLAVVYDTGERVRIGDFGQFLNVDVSLGPDRAPGTVRGLLGTNDDDPSNDFTLPDGSVLAQPLSISEIEDQFGDAWRVTDETSLLFYAPGETTATFTDLAFPTQAFALEDVPPEIFQQGLQAALAAGITDPALLDFAIYDYLVTGGGDLLEHYAGLQQTGRAGGPLLVPEDVPETSPSVGVTAQVDPVTEEAGASTTATFQVYRIGPTEDPISIDFAAAAGGTGFFDAADFGGSFPEGQVTIPADAASASFTIEIPNTAITLAAERLLVEIAAPSGLMLINQSAETTVLNDGPVSGAPAEPLFQEFDPDFALTRDGNDWTLDLGQIAQDAAVNPIDVSVLNDAIAMGNLLSGNFSVDGNGGFDLRGIAPFLDIAPGAEGGGFRVELDTATAGLFQTVITLDGAESNATGFMADVPDQTLTLIAEVTSDGTNTPPEADDATGTVREGALAGTAVAQIAASDPDGDTLDFAITGGDPDGLFAIDGDGLITVAESGALDFESDPAFSLEISVSDAEATVTATATISVEDLNEPTGTRGTFRDDLIIAAEGGQALAGRGGDDILVGGPGADFLLGQVGDDVLSGGGANDWLIGGRGIDVMLGGAGNDALFGWRGDDWLEGGPGADLMIGGRGADSFILAVGEGRDKIVDFGRGADRIGLADGLSFSDLTIDQAGTQATVSAMGEVLAILTQTDVSALGEDVFFEV